VTESELPVSEELWNGIVEIFSEEWKDRLDEISSFAIDKVGVTYRKVLEELVSRSEWAKNLIETAIDTIDLSSILNLDSEKVGKAREIMERAGRYDDLISS
jgi:hypothetical protein